MGTIIQKGWRKMLGRIKEYVFRDVSNPNENGDGAITLRISSLIVIAYLLFLVFLVIFAKGAGIILCNFFFVAVYGYAFWLTYCDMTRGAMLWFNGATLGFVSFNVVYLGWDSGIQHFLFMLILFDLLFTYMSKATQCLVAVVLCMIRLYLYYYCRVHAKIVKIEGMQDVILQVVTTVVVFTLLYICGVMLSKDSQEVERKLKKYNEELEQTANMDTLTRLWNRHYLMNYMGKKLKESKEFMAIAIGDIDFFKKINDTYGHDCGDEVLRTLAQIFIKQMEGNGVVARWGGEEFIFIFENVNGDEAKEKLGKLQNAIKKTVIPYENENIKVTMTFGLVEYDNRYNLDENIRVADERLYLGKEAGRDRIVY